VDGLVTSIEFAGDHRGKNFDTFEARPPPQR
jgi:hypothetical protein